MASVAPGPSSPGSGGGRNAAPPYTFPAMRAVNHYVPHTPVRVSALRSLGAHANVFASESFVDEIAAAHGATLEIGAGASGYGVRMLVEITSRMTAALRRGAQEAAQQAGARAMRSFRRKQEDDDD